MNAVSNNAASFGAITFGSPEYFALKRVDRSGGEVAHQTFNSKEMADYLGLNRTSR